MFVAFYLDMCALHLGFEMIKTDKQNSPKNWDEEQKWGGKLILN